MLSERGEYAGAAGKVGKRTASMNALHIRLTSDAIQSIFDYYPFGKKRRDYTL